MTATRRFPISLRTHPGVRTGIALGLAGLFMFPATGWSWGFTIHRLINKNAISNLPPDFQAFGQWADDLESMAIAADERKCCVPGEDIRHYIDIDDYPEFFSGTFPHGYNDAVNQYGVGRLESNGIGPWALEESYGDLVAFFTARDWISAVATAADIGHYAGDLHQPLHLTRNFDGQETNQRGIHSRFESRMTGQHLASFTPRPGVAARIEDPVARTFEWIDAIYPGVQLILSADLSARSQSGGSTSNDVYYDALWESVGQDTWHWIGEASMDIAALWYSAWLEAGSPPLPGSTPVEAATWSAIKSLYRDREPSVHGLR